MYKITDHPILDIPNSPECTFKFSGIEIRAQTGQTIAAALHQLGYPVHSHSLQKRSRSLVCGIGKCGACEMLVDGEVRRICVTLVDNVKKIELIGDHAQSADILSEKQDLKIGGLGTSTESEMDFSLTPKDTVKCYHTTVAIIGAGPAGLAAREELNKYGVHNLVIDANAEIGGQFLMQTHAFFFFEKEKRFGGMRGFDIAKDLAKAGSAADSFGGNDFADSFKAEDEIKNDAFDNFHDSGILLRSTVWDVLEGNKIGVKNLDTDEIFYVCCKHLVVATGALPFMPAFENDDMPGVYTAAVFQKMMNSDYTLLGKNVLTVGAGNIGYLTSYQAVQAGANVKVIIEAMPKSGGFPVQENRVKRLGIPILTSKILLKAIPNKNNDGIIGAVVADCENFKPVEGSEQIITGIDVINICTGLLPDNKLLVKGKSVFGENCRGIGDAIRIGEGTSAVLHGKQCAYEILQALGVGFPYEHYLEISKENIDSRQKPVKIREDAIFPDEKRAIEKPFVVLDCIYAFACNPCSFSCKYGAISKSSTSTIPFIDYDKCIGCMDCISQCPGLAIFGYDLKKSLMYLPFEYKLEKDAEVVLVDTAGKPLGYGVVDKIIKKKTLTHIARIKCVDENDIDIRHVRGFYLKNDANTTDIFKSEDDIEDESLRNAITEDGKTYICHCDDVTLEEILEQIGGRKFISVDEIKHTTHLAMGPCRGQRCIPRLKLALKDYGIELTGDATPRAPSSSPIQIQELCGGASGITDIFHSKHKEIKVRAFIAGGGMAGSSLFRYMAEEKLYPLLANTGRGGSWRNLAGGRPAFSVPELAEIANENRKLFIELNNLKNIDYKPIRYVSFAHDESSYKNLEAAMSWSDAYMVEPKDFPKEVSPFINKDLNTYKAAQITKNCWQATPGKTIDLLREIGKEKGGVVLENCEIISVTKNDKSYEVWVQTHQGEYVKCICEYFVNALGNNAEKFANMLGIYTNLYPVRHQAFITRRLPMLGINGDSLDMLIDRQLNKGFSAVYGQQLNNTGQIILCASPSADAVEANADIKLNTKEFLEYSAQTLLSWLPSLKGEGLQAAWAGYYMEDRYIIDPDKGLFVGMRGHGFMLSMHMAKLYVDALKGKPVPDYFKRLALGGDSLSETAFK